MLGVLAQPDAAGVRADRHAELRGQQQHRQHLVDAAEPAAVELADVDRVELQQLLEHDAVLDVLAGRDPIGATASRIAGARATSSGLVGSSIQYGSNSRERADAIDGLLDSHA